MPSPVRRLVLIGSFVLVLAACQSTATPEHTSYRGIWVENLPKHRVYDLNWIERAPKNLAAFRVKRLEVGPTGWRATVSFTNSSRRALRLPTGGRRSPINFGLGVFIDVLSPRVEDPGNYLIHASISPALPRVLQPSETWSGTFSSPQPPRNSRYLRVLFGTFFWVGKPPYGFSPYFVWVTSHGVRAPGPQGTAGVTSS